MICAYVWKPHLPHPDTVTGMHECVRDTGHLGDHRCECGKRRQNEARRSELAKQREE